MAEEIKKEFPFGKVNDEGILEINTTFRVSNDLLDFIPVESVELYKIIPLELKERKLTLGALDPENLDTKDALNFISSRQGIEYKLFKIVEKDFNLLYEQYNRAGAAVNEALEEFENQEEVVLGIGDEDLVSSGDFIREEAPVIKLVSTILSQAVDQGASDIHIEPHITFSLVRFRIDGILKESLKFPIKVHSPLVARIKILSSLRLDERRRPQDGRFSSSIRGARVDFRVSTFPTSDGEKAVLRVLDRQKGLRSLAELGLSDESYKVLLEAVNRPYGLILASGPTGAGKTTTLYALLNILDKKSKNIVSLEDPVEYSLDGINQSNIRPEIGYSFASGLRSVLRGDPDQILVGEIRDKETAQLAIQAALTGHVVFSTIHTNTAIGAVYRLINFGIPPFLLAPTLSLVIGQRMTRRISGESKDLPVGAGMRKHLDKTFSTLPTVYKKNIPEFKSFKEVIPTSENPSGLKGRIGVFELFNIDEEIRGLILETASEGRLMEAARKKGMFTLQEDAIIKGLGGIIPLAEVVKVGSENAFGSIESDDQTNTKEEQIEKEGVEDSGV